MLQESKILTFDGKEGKKEDSRWSNGGIVIDEVKNTSVGGMINYNH